MAMAFESVGLTARTDKEEALSLASRLADHLKAIGLDIEIDPAIAERIGKVELAVPLERWKQDFIITIGGDGTILRTCIHIPKPEPPILAINMGERGFLTEVSSGDAVSAVDRSLDGQFEVEKCKKLAVHVEDQALPDALNEVYISANVPVKLLYANLWKNGSRILDCRADGIIIASPTGSTGYSIAAGGPVLDPQANVFVLTPVCSLGSFSPVVFSENSTLAVEIERPPNVLVVIDGYYRRLVEKEEVCVTVQRSNNVTSFIRFEKKFYERLRNRLLYPEGECYQRPARTQAQ